METAAERRSMADAWGDKATIGAVTIPGQFEQPQAEDQLVEGTAPEFIAYDADLRDAAITRGTIIDRVTRADGQVFGPFKIVRWRSLGDGTDIALGLEQR